MRTYHSVSAMTSSFSELGLLPELVQTLHNSGFTIPTPIQQEAIPKILSGQDVLGTAMTGSGKTIAFVLPILQHIIQLAGKGDRSRNPKTLILTPTRELAKQIGERILEYSGNHDIKFVIIYGGVKQKKQEYYLNQGADIVIATPGRLMDLEDQNIVDLSEISMFTLDEADRMLDMGFIDDIKYLLNKIPSTRQILLFSATMEESIKKLADEILKKPELIEVDQPSTMVSSIDSKVYLIEERDKINFLRYLLEIEWMDKLLIFVNTRKKVDQLAELLYKFKIKSGVIHSEKTQEFREFTLKNFRKGKFNILIATDVASRGIDIDDITHVINYDVPEYAEDYVHRIGRTGRAGREGISYTFCSEKERRFLLRIEELIGQKIEEPASYRFKSRIPFDPSKYDIYNKE